MAKICACRGAKIGTGEGSPLVKGMASRTRFSSFPRRMIVYAALMTTACPGVNWKTTNQQNEHEIFPQGTNFSKIAQSWRRTYLKAAFIIGVIHKVIKRVWLVINQRARVPTNGRASPGSAAPKGKPFRSSVENGIRSKASTLKRVMQAQPKKTRRKLQTMREQDPFVSWLNARLAILIAYQCPISCTVQKGRAKIRNEKDSFVVSLPSRIETYLQGRLHYWMPPHQSFDDTRQ